MVVVRKRVKGKKVYYYLEYSMREGKRVVKKEKYLGTEVPKDVDKIKEQFEKEIQSELYKKLEKIKDSFQAEWQKIPPSIREKELGEIVIAFTYNTNAIEGSTISLEETRGILHDNIAPNKPLRDIKETETHAKAFLEMLHKKEKVSKELILRWHEDIFKQTKPDIAGKFREYLVRVGAYRAPDWQDVERLMNRLIEFINKNNKMNPVMLAAKAHYRFEKIHPFGDGNGRIGRLLMNHILWHNDYPMLVIEHKRRKVYYKALSKDEEAFTNYFIKRYLSIHKKKQL